MGNMMMMMMGQPVQSHKQAAAAGDSDTAGMQQHIMTTSIVCDLQILLVLLYPSPLTAMLRLLGQPVQSHKQAAAAGREKGMQQHNVSAEQLVAVALPPLA
jgi:hypothetical protein